MNKKEQQKVVDAVTQELRDSRLSYKDTHYAIEIFYKYLSQVADAYEKKLAQYKGGESVEDILFFHKQGKHKQVKMLLDALVAYKEASSMLSDTSSIKELNNSEKAKKLEQVIDIEKFEREFNDEKRKDYILAVRVYDSLIASVKDS